MEDDRSPAFLAEGMEQAGALDETSHPATPHSSVPDDVENGLSAATTTAPSDTAAATDGGDSVAGTQVPELNEVAEEAEVEGCLPEEVPAVCEVFEAPAGCEVPAAAAGGGAGGDGLGGLLGRIGAAVGEDLQRLDKVQFDTLVNGLRGLTTEGAQAAEVAAQPLHMERQQYDEPEAEAPPAPAAPADLPHLPLAAAAAAAGAGASALEPSSPSSAAAGGPLDSARGEATAWGPNSGRGSSSARAARAAAQRYRDRGEGLTVQERLAQIEFSDDEDEDEGEDGAGGHDPTAGARRREPSMGGAVTVEACEAFAPPHAGGALCGGAAPCQVEELQAF